MFRTVTVLLTAGLVLGMGCSQMKSGAGSSGDLATWRVAGVGTIQKVPEEKAFRVTEGKDSKGVTIVSPRAYGRNTVMKFRIKPERREGVVVAVLSATDKKTGNLALEQNRDGAMAFWTSGTVQDYLIAFHTAYHQPNIFIQKNPGSKMLAQTPDVAGQEKWYNMEIGRDGSRIWVKVDGKIALEATDPDNGGIPGGYCGLRLRGPGDGSYSCLIRDMKISE